MEIYVPTSAKEFSQRKLEEYAKYEKVIVMGHAIMIQTITGEKRPFEYGEVVVWKNGENEAFL